MADTEHAEEQGRHVVYCGVCTLPPEFCEFGGTVKKCQEWLEKNHKDQYEKLWSPEALEAQTSTLSLDAQKRAAKDAAKKASKAEAAEAKNSAAMSASKVIIKRIERNKRKYVTSVSGLEPFGLELKKVSKEFGKKFATGTSVTKTASGTEEIIVQGDVSEEIEEFLQEKWPGVVPEDNVELVEDKKKKSSS